MINPAQYPYRKETQTGVEYFFPTFGTYLHAVENPTEGRAVSKETGRRDEWFGTRNYSEAIQLAKDGWLGVDETVRKIANGIIGPLGSLMPSIEWERDLTGEAVDIASFLSGEPECYLTPNERLVTGNRIFRVLVPYAGHCGIGPKAFHLLGALTVALCELVEKSGHQTEVIICEEANNSKSFKMACLIKEAGQPLDVPLLAFQVGHPSMLRRLRFRLMEGDELAKELGAEPGGGYGHPHYAFTTDGSFEADIVCPTVVAISDYMIGGGEEAQLIAWLKKKLQAFGIIGGSEQ